MFAGSQAGYPQVPRELPPAGMRVLPPPRSVPQAVSPTFSSSSFRAAAFGTRSSEAATSYFQHGTKGNIVPQRETPPSQPELGIDQRVSSKRLLPPPTISEPKNRVAMPWAVPDAPVAVGGSQGRLSESGGRSRSPPGEAPHRFSHAEGGGVEVTSGDYSARHEPHQPHLNSNAVAGLMPDWRNQSQSPGAAARFSKRQSSPTSEGFPSARFTASGGRMEHGLTTSSEEDCLRRGFGNQRYGRGSSSPTRLSAGESKPFGTGENVLSPRESRCAPGGNILQGQMCQIQAEEKLKLRQRSGSPAEVLRASSPWADRILGRQLAEENIILQQLQAENLRVNSPRGSTQDHPNAGLASRPPRAPSLGFQPCSVLSRATLMDLSRLSPIRSGASSPTTPQRKQSKGIPVRSPPSRNASPVPVPGSIFSPRHRDGHASPRLSGSGTASPGPRALFKSGSCKAPAERVDAESSGRSMDRIRVVPPAETGAQQATSPKPRLPPRHVTPRATLKPAASTVDDAASTAASSRGIPGTPVKSFGFGDSTPGTPGTPLVQEFAARCGSSEAVPMQELAAQLVGLSPAASLELARSLDQLLKKAELEESKSAKNADPAPVLATEHHLDESTPQECQSPKNATSAPALLTDLTLKEPEQEECKSPKKWGGC